MSHGVKGLPSWNLAGIGARLRPMLLGQGGALRRWRWLLSPHARPSSEKPPILWVLDLRAKKWGSMEVQLLELARLLRRAGHPLRIVFASPPPDWFSAKFEAEGVALGWLDFRRPLSPSLRLARCLREEPAALVHFHFVRAYSPLVAVARLFGARVLVHDHLALEVPFRPSAPRRPSVARAIRLAKRARAALLNRWCDRRIAVSPYVAGTVARAEFVSPDRIEVVEHGLLQEVCAPAEVRALRAALSPDGLPLVVSVARIAHEKGIDLLVRAIAKMERDAILVLAGDGDGRAACEALAAELGVAHRVRFLGLRRDVAAIWRSADVAVVPSRAPEAFGLALVEAMVAARPVVVTDAGALPGIIDGGRCGVIVPPGDADALAAAITRLLEDRTEAAALAEAAAERAAQRYGLARWLRRMEGIYAVQLDRGAGADGFTRAVG